MTKRRPSNKKPVGVNASLGNSLVNERRQASKSHILTKFHEDGYTGDSLPDSKSKKNVKSVTQESSLEEFLSKVDLAETNFTAEREDVKFIEQSTSSVVPTKLDVTSKLELQKKYSQRLKIPRRPPKDTWNSAEELSKLENESFLEWRRNIAELQQVDGLVLTPFERNLELWKQLWRVVEQSDIVVQIVDARNPLLFRNVDLEKYVNECGPAKKNIMLVNKTDLLTTEQIKMWSDYFITEKIDAVFWSALSSKTTSDSSDSASQVVPSESDFSDNNSVKEGAVHEIPFLHTSVELINLFKSRVGSSSSSEYARSPIVVGMVGYPNVGKSSTINRILGKKKVSVSATPGKTLHLQTLVVDKELTLCDCPGLVMPSFALNRDAMLLNGILPADQMRECFGPIGLLASRIPRKCFELMYSVMLPPPAEHEDPNRSPTAHEVLVSVAFMRGFMSAAGIPDCSRAARMIVKDVANGKVKWVAAPPHVPQDEFDQYTYSQFLTDRNIKDSSKKGDVVLKQLEKRHLLCSTGVTVKNVDEQFFSLSQSEAHIVQSNTMYSKNYKHIADNGKLLKKRKKEKLRRVYAHLDA